MLQIAWGSSISYQLSIRHSRTLFYKTPASGYFYIFKNTISWFLIDKINRYLAPFLQRFHLLEKAQINEDNQTDKVTWVKQHNIREFKEK